MRYPVCDCDDRLLVWRAGTGLWCLPGSGSSLLPTSLAHGSFSHGRSADMTDRSRPLVFAWERLLFVAHLAGSRLLLTWTSLDLREGSNGLKGGADQLDGNNSGSSLSSDDGGDFVISRHPKTSTTNFRRYDDNCTDTNTTSFDVSSWSDCQLTAVRPRCDGSLLKKHPVVLLKCANIQIQNHNPVNVEYLFLQVTEVPSRLHGSCVSHTGLVGENIQCKTSDFSLVPLQSYSFTTSHNLTWHKHLAVLPDLQLLCVHPDSMSVMLCTPDAVSSHDIRLTDVSLAADCKNISDVHIIDAFSIAEDRTVVALVSYMTADRLTECQSLKFSPTSFTSHTSAGSYSMVQLPLDVFFAAHYTEILKVASISSFSCTYNLISKSVNFDTSLTMLTQTGYALKFSDGVLKCCINLTSYSDTVWSPENWSHAFVKIINCDGCPDKVAVQVNSTCCLIDWTTEQIVKTWQSVFTAISCDVHVCGISSLVVVLHPETAESPGTTTSAHLLQGCTLVVVDVDDLCAGAADGAVLLDSGMTRPRIGQEGQRCAEDEHMSQPLCAANALVGQQRQCLQAVSEMESQLRNKLAFLSDTWQQLADLHVGGGSQARSHTASSHQLPVTVLVEGCLPSLSCQETVRVQQDCRKYVDTGSVWKRLVDTLLVVGVQVENVSLSHLRDVQIRLVPVAHCQTSIMETTSKSHLAAVASGISLHSTPGLQGQTDQRECDQDSECNKRGLLPPGKLTVATCMVDISSAVSAHDLTLHMFLSYSVLDCDKCPAGESMEGQVSVRHVDDCCAEIVVTPCQMLGDGCCLGASGHLAAATLTTTDLLALDCIQKRWTLLLSSVVSSVTCLALKLSQDPRVRYLDWAQQFLFVDTAALKYSRLQILELSSRYSSTIQIFARSQSQALLLVKFLYSILPEDITITLDMSHDMPAVSHINKAALQDVERRITALKQHLAAAPPPDPGTSLPTDPGTSLPTDPGTSLPTGGSLSPKFLGSKQVRYNQAAGPAAPVQGPGTDTSRCRLAERAPETGGVATEKRSFRVAKKRFRDIWGDDDSP